MFQFVRFILSDDELELESACVCDYACYVIFYKRINRSKVRNRPKTGTFENSEDPDEMQHKLMLRVRTGLKST